MSTANASADRRAESDHALLVSCHHEDLALLHVRLFEQPPHLARHLRRAVFDLSRGRRRDAEQLLPQSGAVAMNDRPRAVSAW